MKKSTLSAIYSALNDTFGWFDNGANAEVREDLEKELNRDAERKAQSAQAYESIHDLIVSNLGSAPVTCAELYESIKSELPEGITKGKVQYALTHLWSDEIVKIEGKPNTYRRA